jgi:hypothetical protein
MPEVSRLHPRENKRVRTRFEALAVERGEGVAKTL